MPKPHVIPLIHPEKLPYAVFIILMVLHTLIYIEAYTLPLSTSFIIAENVYNVHHKSRRGGDYYLYYAQAGGHKYKVDGYMYDNLNAGDTFFVHKAYFTRKVLETSFIRGGSVHTYNSSITQTPPCIIFSLLLTAGTIIYLIMYSRISGEPGGRNLFYFLAGLWMAFIFFYL
jgi:hypothetical protein